MRWLLLLALWLCAPAAAQTAVEPDELGLEVSVESGDAAPYVGEMVLLTIHGIYRRHVTRERLEQPPLDGFSWMQLGDDYWYDSMVGGLKVRNMKRRMALFPEAAGRLTIGPFTHHLTLLDDGNDWFEHPVSSQPITIDVRPHPEVEGWWLPVKRLEVSDTWSNPPDQLEPGQGVLRIVRVEATGIAPELLPPMPELASPSGHVFPHPEKRLVSLSPEGPISTAFWRWTIKPEGPSAILEPISFGFFDTEARVMRRVTISPQRVAMAPAAAPEQQAPPPRGRLARVPVLAALAAGTLGGLLPLVWGRRGAPGAVRQALAALAARRALARAARARDIAAFRRAASALPAAATREGSAVLAEVDAALFGREAPRPDLGMLRRRLLRAARGLPRHEVIPDAEARAP